MKIIQNFIIEMNIIKNFYLKEIYYEILILFYFCIRKEIFKIKISL
jgi:hypothetical protein